MAELTAMDRMIVHEATRQFLATPSLDLCELGGNSQQFFSRAQLSLVLIREVALPLPPHALPTVDSTHFPPYTLLAVDTLTHPDTLAHSF